MPHHGEYDEAWLIANQFCRIATGQYTGDGTIAQAILGIGFRPKWVWIDQHQVGAEGNTDTFWRSDQNARAYQPTGGAFFLSYYIDDRLISLDADGFTVDDDGVNSPPNAAGVTYDYLCLG